MPDPTTPSLAKPNHGLKNMSANPSPGRTPPNLAQPSLAEPNPASPCPTSPYLAPPYLAAPGRTLSNSYFFPFITVASNMPQGPGVLAPGRQSPRPLYRP